MILFGNKEFATKKDLFAFMVENKTQIIAQKKAVKKEVDCAVLVAPVIVHDKPIGTNKAEDQVIDPINVEQIKVVCIINTTNFLDSHQDVHIPGIWNKSINNNKMIMHLQEHSMDFESIIADGKDLKAYTKYFKWSELGYDYEGETEALVFESVIRRKRNEFMLNQYANGWVKSHSVGMYYVKMGFALNDEEYPNEYDAWKKYYPEIVNPEMADERGYFWYILEAKCVEGSAVPIGSNTATPTISVGKSTVTCASCGHEFNYESQPEAGMGYVNCPNCNEPVTEGCKPRKNKPSKDTLDKNEPDNSTQSINYKFLIDNLKLK